MELPNISPKHDYYEYWKPVETGEKNPDEWQSALMELDKKAHEIGLFYVCDVDKWIKENNDFIPEEWWSFQYLPPKSPVEHGIMGMELYSAHAANREAKLRAENKAVIETLVVGGNYGSFSVNGKRVNKCTLKDVRGGTVTFTGMTGRYSCEFWTDAKNVPSMIEKAKGKGWRK
jgi:hypothetical protein